MVRNDKTSPRVDAQREHELKGFIQGAPVPNRDDAKLQEEIGRIEPGRRPEVDEPGPNGQPSIQETFVRSEFSRWFLPSAFPATAGVLVEQLRDEAAPDWVVEAVERLAPDQRFDDIGHVYDAVGPVEEGDEP
ncbi:MAG TPA: DUF2795 domain-containing protein [Aquihabitans sp.]|jgi:hypothetical protein|nr:DUF2795 domain-containing protein [Aquihabitans sp.]